MNISKVWTKYGYKFLVHIYFQGAFVLYNFREYVSERKMIRLLHGFLVDHQLLNEITRDVGSYETLVA